VANAYEFARFFENERTVGDVRLDEFQRNFVIEPEIPRQVDVAERPFTNFAQKLEIAPACRGTVGLRDRKLPVW
jgi:hypothetical protein